MALDVSKPVEMPSAFSRIVDRVLDQFVKEQASWEAVHWYHDEPIWFVRKREGDLVARVQISAFRVQQNSGWGVALKLIPSVYLVKDGRALQDAEKAVARARIVSIPLESPDALEKRLWDDLAEACRVAASLPHPS